MRRIIFLAYYFPPAGGAGVQRALKFVQYLPAEGFLPVVITAPTSPDNRWTPQDSTLMDAIPAGVPVHRVEQVAALKGRLQSRVERWFGLPSAFSKWWIESASELGSQVENADLILATMSPFESGEAARRLSIRLGLPWVADLRDPWALDEMQVYPTLLHRKLEMRKMQRLLSTAALIVMNTPEAARALRAAYPGLHDRPVVSITNGFDGADFAGPVPPREDGKFRIVHSGYLHTDQGLQLRARRMYRLLAGAEAGVDILTRSHTVLLEAIERWRSRWPEVDADVEIVLAGKTSHEDRAVVSSSTIARMVRFPGYVSHRESVELVRTADLLFLPMHNLLGTRRSRIVPGKTYEYMAAGRPILAAVPDGDAKDFLRQCGTALICAPNDVAAMVRLLDQAYSAWKKQVAPESSDMAFVSQFERCHLTHTLATAMRSVLRSGDSETTSGVTLGTNRMRATVE